ncbi:hypothetical protein D3C72_1284670 [compost metagenome]
MQQSFKFFIRHPVYSGFTFDTYTAAVFKWRYPCITGQFFSAGLSCKICCAANQVYRGNMSYPRDTDQ